MPSSAQDKFVLQIRSPYLRDLLVKLITFLFLHEFLFSFMNIVKNEGIRVTQIGYQKNQTKNLMELDGLLSGYWLVAWW